MKNFFIVVLVIICLLLAGILTGQISFKGQERLGSVTVGNSYIATTTPDTAEWTDQTIRAGWGSLGSVIITKAGDLNFQLYNATSTGAVNNDSRFIKSTHLLADFPADTAAGTYVFDTQYTDGLVLEVVSGTLGTSTITFR